MSTSNFQKAGVGGGVGLILTSVYFTYVYVDHWFLPDYKKYLIFGIILFATGFFVMVLSAAPEKFKESLIVSGIFTYAYFLGILYLTDIQSFYYLILATVGLLLVIYLWYRDISGGARNA